MTQGNAPSIIAPPPLLYLAALALLVVLDWFRPVPILDHALVAWIGWMALVLGIALNLWGAWSMKRVRTPINPYRRVEAIVSSGAFRVSRNPLYVGLDLVLLGVALVLDSLWGVAILAVLLPVMHYGVIRPEERYLEEEFAEEYARYRAKTRRYL